MKLKNTFASLLLLSGLGLFTVVNSQSVFMLHRGSDANNNVASIIEIDMNGDLIGQWTATVEPDSSAKYMYLSSTTTRRYMSRSHDGNHLSFTGFARLDDGSNESTQFSFDLETRSFNSSTGYTGGGALRSAATVDGSAFWVAGTTRVNGINYLEGGYTSNGIGITSSTVAREQVLFHNNRMWVSREGGSTHGVSFLDMPPGNFPTSAWEASLNRLSGDGWNHDSGAYQGFNFLGTDTLFVGTGDGTNSVLKTFIHNPEATSLTEGWNLLKDDVLSGASAGIVGVSSLEDPENGEISVFYSTAEEIWRVTYDPNAPNGDKFSTPELFASGLLGEGELWGGVVAK